MIIGDKIVTSHVQRDGVPQPVEVVGLVGDEITWRYTWRGVDYAHRWHIKDADLNGWWARGTLRKRDRGITWAPAWLEDEVLLLRTVCAL